MILPNRTAPQGLLPLELRILPRGPSQPKNYKLSEPKILKKIFPSTPSSMDSLRLPDFGTLSDDILTRDNFNLQNLRILKLRRTLPHFDSNFRHIILKLDLPRWDRRKILFGFQTSSGVTSPSVKCLNRIFKQAKNLKSVTLQPRCEISNFKGLRKARDLQNLSLNIDGRHIKAYPQLFKGLVHLQTVILKIRNLDSEENKKFFKFFDDLLSLPRLQHVTIWLNEYFGYYQRLLDMTNEKKLPSFHIRDDSRHADCEKYLPQVWGNYIDTLSLGPIELNQPLSQKKPKKKLSLRSLGDFFIPMANPRIDMVKPLLEFFSKTKNLENITLIFEPASSKSGHIAIVSEFIERFSQIESLESLQTLTFSSPMKGIFPKILPPYSSRMKNLRALDIKLSCEDLELFYFMEVLKNFELLEEFEFSYYENNQNRKQINCDIPLECLRNLKKMSLIFYVRFSEASAKNLIEGIHKLGNLRVLFVSPVILEEIGSKNAERLIEDFRGMRSLESASFAWRQEVSEKLVYVDIHNENGEIKVWESVE